MVIYLVIATVCYDILFDRMIPHALYVDSQPYIVRCDIYINAVMDFIMHNVEIMRYLMQYDDISISNDIYFSSQRL